MGVNYAVPGKALGLLMGLAVAGMLINWAMISYSHLRFRAAKRAAGATTAFPSPLYPLIRRVKSLPGWLAGTSAFGLSNKYTKFCVASEGYKGLFNERG